MYSMKNRPQYVVSNKEKNEIYVFIARKPGE